MRAFVLIITLFIAPLTLSSANLSYYKSQISFLYLYNKQINIIYELHNMEFWTDEKVLKNLRTSLSLTRGLLRDFEKVSVTKRSKEIHTSVKLCFQQAISTTTTFITGLEEENRQWHKNYARLSAAWEKSIIELAEMEE